MVQHWNQDEIVHPAWDETLFGLDVVKSSDAINTVGGDAMDD